jgi:ATP-dependent Clp protease ATP-binding subunit ClpC
MTERDDAPVGRAGLTAGARQLLSQATEAHSPGRPWVLGDWLLAMLQRNGPLAESMVPDLRSAAVLAELRSGSSAGAPGAPLDEATLIARAIEHAAARERPHASEVDIAAVLLALAGHTVPPPAEIGLLARRTSAAAAGEPTTTPQAAASPAAARQGPLPWHPRADQPTPTLDRFGRDLTRQAADGQLGGLVGRERELDLIIETLCRRQKRNPVLLGAAGSGKTAIVEGLAGRIVRDQVPVALRGVRIVQLQPSSLVAGAGIVGELETRMRAILDEARQDGIVLFIDEVHAIVGTGGMRGTGDLASLLKPALARGDLACIAATTDDEYRRFIAEDAALERRFNPVVVDELDEPSTLAVLRSHRDELSRLRGVRVGDDVLEWLVHFAAAAMPNRTFPDKAVDLLEQCVAHAVAHGHGAVDRATAEDVARRTTGVPLSIGERLGALERDLALRALSNPEATRHLIARLGVTMRGLDSRRGRPNAVVLVAGTAAPRARELAETMANALFGNPNRVVSVDLARMTGPHDVAMLVGAPPGYVGYSDRLPIHRLAAMPWSVLLCEGAEAAHPVVRELLAEAFEDGAFVDGGGRRIALSDTVVVLVCGDVEAGHRLGFQAAGTARSEGGEAVDAGRSATATRALGERLAALVDVEIIAHRAPPDAAPPVERTLELLAQRFAREGISLEWDASVRKWLLERAGPSGDIDAAADRELLPRLAPLVGEPGGERAFRVAAGPKGLRVVPKAEAVPVVTTAERARGS